MPAKIDDRFFRLSMKLMAQNPKKNGPDVLNKSVLKIAIGAKGQLGLVQLTQKATRARIEGDLKRNKLGLKLATRELKKRGDPITRANISKMYEAIRKSRVQSRAYIAAGWLFSASKLAKAVPGHKLTRLKPRNIPTRDDASAAQSFAKFATMRSLNAGLFNTSRGAGSVCPDPVVQMAIDNATVDNNLYLRRKFGAAIDDAIAFTNKAQSVAD